MPQQELPEFQEIWKTISAGKVLDGRIAIVAEATKHDIDVEKAKKAARLTECIGNINGGIAKVKELQCRSCRMHDNCGIEAAAVIDSRPIGGFTKELVEAAQNSDIRSIDLDEISRQWNVMAAYVDRDNPFGGNYINEVDTLLELGKTKEIHKGSVNKVGPELLDKMINANLGMDWVIRIMLPGITGIDDMNGLVNKIKERMAEQNIAAKKGKVPSFTYEQRYSMFQRGRELIEQGMSVNGALITIEEDKILNPDGLSKANLYNYFANGLSQIRPENKGKRKGNRHKNEVQHEQSTNTLGNTMTDSERTDVNVKVESLKPAGADQVHANGNGIQKTVVMSPDAPQFYNPSTRPVLTEKNGHERIEQVPQKKEVVKVTKEGFGVERTDDALRFNLRGVGINFDINSFESFRNNGSAEKLVMLESLIKDGCLEIRNPRVRTRTLIELNKFLNAVLFTDTEYVTFDKDNLVLAGINREP